jgi:cytochrome P450
MRVLDGVVSGMIEERRRGEPRGDMLSMLLDARDPATGEGMGDRQLRDEVMSLLLAGHETTANVLTWTLYLLAQHPDEQERVHAEAALSLEAHVGPLEQAKQLAYASMVLQESMRLYPPAWLFGRSPIEDDEIEGFHVEAGSLVFLSAYVTHRHPGLWPEPERFDPGRFAPGQAASLDRFAYFPFGGGPRLCIGAPFASLEMPIVLASLARRLRFRLAPDAVVALEPLVTLRPRHGMPLRVERR